MIRYILSLWPGVMISGTTCYLAHEHAQGEGTKRYVNKVQRLEFTATEKGYTFVAHQQEVDAGYFDDVTTVIHGRSSSVTTLSRPTREDQF